MAGARAEDEIAAVEEEIKQFWASLKSIHGGEQVNQTTALRDSCKESVKALTEKWSQKLKEEDLMIDKIKEYYNEQQALKIRNNNIQHLPTAVGKVHETEILQQNKLISENEENFTEIKANLNHEEEQNKSLMDSIRELKEELIKKKEIIDSKNKATKERMEQLCKSKALFEERLGLEIRRIHDEQLQFIFRHIDHKDPEKPYTFTLFINEQGDYEVTACSPPLECIAEFQQKVRETNNFSTFIANIRKAFTELSYK